MLMRLAILSKTMSFFLLLGLFWRLSPLFVNGVSKLQHNVFFSTLDVTFGLSHRDICLAPFVNRTSSFKIHTLSNEKPPLVSQTQKVNMIVFVKAQSFQHLNVPKSMFKSHFIKRHRDNHERSSNWLSMSFSLLTIGGGIRALIKRPFCAGASHCAALPINAQLWRIQLCRHCRQPCNLTALELVWLPPSKCHVFLSARKRTCEQLRTTWPPPPRSLCLRDGGDPNLRSRNIPPCPPQPQAKHQQRALQLFWWQNLIVFIHVCFIVTCHSTLAAYPSCEVFVGKHQTVRMSCFIPLIVFFFLWLFKTTGLVKSGCQKGEATLQPRLFLLAWGRIFHILYCGCAITVIMAHVYWRMVVGFLYKSKYCNTQKK